MINFFIIIILKDDLVLYFVNNIGLEINEGEIKWIFINLLLVYDMDFIDENIMYVII